MDHPGDKKVEVNANADCGADSTQSTFIDEDREAPAVEKEMSRSGQEKDDVVDEVFEVEPEIQVDRKQMAILSIAMALAVFLFALDETIIATAIPKITDQFHSLADVGWYGSAYLLTMCCFQLHYGKFYKLFSTKAVFLVSISIFELGSLLCAVSPNSSTLIVGRALSGSGACGIMSGVLIIVSKMVPLRERALYSAGIGSIRGVAGVAGPLLGGVITDSVLTWRWFAYSSLFDASN